MFQALLHLELEIKRMLSDRALAVLRMMAATDEELVADGLSCWVGEELTSRSTLKTLLRCLALSDVSDTNGLERYVINGTGRAIAEKPSLAAAVHKAIIAGTPFKVEDGEIVGLGRQPGYSLN